jgi:hypothetical protein
LRLAESNSALRSRKNAALYEWISLCVNRQRDKAASEQAAEKCTHTEPGKLILLVHSSEKIIAFTSFDPAMAAQKMSGFRYAKALKLHLRFKTGLEQVKTHFFQLKSLNRLL